VCHHKKGIQNVIVDIKPGPHPNPFNPKSKGALKVAILASEDYDVSEIDVSSLLLEGEVPPLWARLKGKHGNERLMLKFSNGAVRDALGDLEPGQKYEVWITGTFKDGTQLIGSDIILVVPWHKPKNPKSFKNKQKAKKK
jgi:hypothetical protein